MITRRRRLRRNRKKQNVALQKVVQQVAMGRMRISAYDEKYITRAMALMKSSGPGPFRGFLRTSY